MSKTTEPCAFEGCGRPRYSRDYCTQHYRQLVNNRPLKPLRAYNRQQAECKVDGCTRKTHARGYCQLHLNRVERHGSTEATRIWNPGAECKVEGCGKPSASHGWCQTHYMRVRRTGDAGGPEMITQPERRSKYAGKTCAVEGCERKPQSRGWCTMHYHRWKRTGDAEGKWGAQPRKSEGYTTTDGYKMAPEKRNGRPVLEHRLVMEQRLGRPLRRFEEPHHKNGIRDDNDRFCPVCGDVEFPQELVAGMLQCASCGTRVKPNLELWVKWRQPNGQRLSDLIEFVVTNYPQEVMTALAARMAEEST